MSESEVDVAPNSTGPAIRTLKQTEPAVVDSTGAAQADSAKHQQVVSLANRRGDLSEDLQNQILTELRLMRELLQVISAQLS